MRTLLYLIACLIVVGCAATVAKYEWCFGFCGSLNVDKEETPKHVTETIKTVTETRQ